MSGEEVQESSLKGNTEQTCSVTLNREYDQHIDLDPVAFMKVWAGKNYVELKEAIVYYKSQALMMVVASKMAMEEVLKSSAHIDAGVLRVMSPDEFLTKYGYAKEKANETYLGALVVESRLTDRITILERLVSMTEVDREELAKALVYIY